MNTTGIATISPSKCIPNKAVPAQKAPNLGSIKAPIRSMYTGSLAEQLIKGATSIVAKRLLASGITLAAIMPGIAHAKLDSKGIKALPFSPHQPRRRSIKNAALDKYPVPSKKAIKKKRIRICGRKTTTPPTPAIIPSTTKL